MVTTRARAKAAASTYNLYEEATKELATNANVSEAPQWLRRPYIYSGYCYGGTPQQAFVATMLGSKGMINNETLNAHTMIWAAALSTYLYYNAWQQFHVNIWPFTMFWLSCVLHTPFSVGLHCTIGVSEEQRSLWRSLDFTLIFSCSVLLALSMAYFVFTNLISFTVFAAVCMLALMRTMYNTMVVRQMKDIPKKECAGYVASMVACYVFPMMLAAGMEVYDQGAGQVTALVTGTVVTLIIGGKMYAQHYPERWAPGRFDLVGNSHQLMHLLAMLAHYCEWRFLCVLAEQHLYTY